jgi:hypothetical protein
VRVQLIAATPYPICQRLFSMLAELFLEALIVVKLFDTEPAPFMGPAFSCLMTLGKFRVTAESGL